MDVFNMERMHTRRPEGPDGCLPMGLGLGAFMLFLFTPLSGTEFVLRAAGATTLLGRPGFFAGAGAFGGGAGRSIIAIVDGRTNIPLPISH